MAKKKLTGINIQYPISQLITSGIKTVETRTYPIPPSYINQELALIETPGKNGKFKSRVTAIITFGPSFRYKDKKEFYLDTKNHCVTPDSKWSWNNKIPKWGWPIINLKIINKQFISKRLGIKYTKNIEILI